MIKPLPNVQKSSTLQLYQQALLQHHKAPIGFEQKFEATYQSKGVNAACGDEIEISVQINNGVITALAFSGDSCAICRASASMMCQHLIEHRVEGIEVLIDNVINMISSPNDEFPQCHEQLHPLLGVRKFPVRKQCAILPWRTFAVALSLK